MKTLNRMTPVVFAVLLLASASAGYAEGRVRPARAHNPFAKVLRCLQIVDLSEDQKTEIRSLLEASRPNLSALAEELRMDRETLKALLDSDGPDECEVGAALLEVEADVDALRAETESVMMSIKVLLSPEQEAMLEGCLHAPPPSADGDQ